MTKHKEKFILILRPRLFGLLTESSARGAGAGATELLFVAPPKQYKNGSSSSCKCLGAAPPKSPFGAAPASPVRRGARAGAQTNRLVAMSLGLGRSGLTGRRSCLVNKRIRDGYRLYHAGLAVGKEWFSPVTAYP